MTRRHPWLRPRALRRGEDSPVLGLHRWSVVPALSLFALLVGVAGATAGWAPELVGGSISGGYESRPLEGTLSEIDPDAGLGDGRYWFAPPEDWGGSLDLWSRWKFRSALGKSRLKLSYGRNDWVDGGIFARDQFGLDLNQALGRGLELEFDLEFVPEVYKRHRVDKDAGPGDPEFRPETYRSLDLELALSRDWGPLASSIFGVLERRDENEWFDERDRLGLGMGAGLDFSAWTGSRLRPFYVRTNTASRNRPDLGSDLSFDEDTFGLRFLQDLGRLRAEIYGKVDFRRYTTSDPEDDNRFGRKDTGRYFSGRLTWRVAELRPFLSFERSRSSTELPGVAAAEQDDGEDERTLARIGVDFEWEL